MLQEDNARKGFFEAAEFRGVLAGLPDAIQPLAEVAYITGWGVRSELLTRQWIHVDFDAGWLRLEPDESKSREGPMFPLLPRLRAVLERQRPHARDRARRDPSDPLGIPPRRDTHQALPAGVVERLHGGRGAPPDPARLPADSGQELERAGVTRSGAMKMVGHNTEAIY